MLCISHIPDTIHYIPYIIYHISFNIYHRSTINIYRVRLSGGKLSKFMLWTPENVFYHSNWCKCLCVWVCVRERQSIMCVSVCVTVKLSYLSFVWYLLPGWASRNPFNRIYRRLWDSTLGKLFNFRTDNLTDCSSIPDPIEVRLLQNMNSYR